MITPELFAATPDTLLNAQRLAALPATSEHALPPVDWPTLGVAANRIPTVIPLTDWQVNSPFPEADVAVITWTSAEWAAMNQVLTNRREPLTPEQAKGHDWRQGWEKYQRD